MISQGGGPPGGPGTWAYDLWLLNEGGGGGYPSQGGYYGTGGGAGYIHGTPQDEIEAWQLFLEMERNGWDPYAPGSIEEARRGMGQFTNEQFDRYFEEYLRNQQPGISTNNFEPGSGEFGSPGGDFTPTDNGPIDLGWLNNFLVAGLGKGKLGKLGIGKYIKEKQGEASLDDWLASLGDDQRRWLDDWMVGLGADKNWADRLRQGDAPWSRGQEAIDQTSRQNPDNEYKNPREPRPGGGPRDKPPKDGGGEGGEPEGSYDGPLGLPTYGGLAFSPSFLAYQPYNTGGPVQFVPGRK